MSKPFCDRPGAIVADRGSLPIAHHASSRYCASRRTPAVVLCCRTMSEPPTAPDSPRGEDGQTPTPLLSKKEAAARLGVTEKTIERYVNEYGLLVPAGQDPRTGAKQFDPADIDRLRQSPPPRRKGGPDIRGVSDLALQGLVAAMQQAHAETVRAKD